MENVCGKIGLVLVQKLGITKIVLKVGEISANNDILTVQYTTNILESII